MTTLYKLTDADGRTYGETQWGEGVTHTTDGEGELCGPGWLHAYTDPLLAVLLNPIHANVTSPRLWECEGEVGQSDHGLKVGCTSLTTTREIPLPVVTTEQRVRFAILCAWEVCEDSAWRVWATGWLDGSDRSKAAAEAAAECTAMAAAAWAAECAAMAAAAWAAAWAEARAMAAAAMAAAMAAAGAPRELNLASIAQRAMEVEAAL